MTSCARNRFGILAIVVASALAGCDWMPGRPRQTELPLRPSAVTDFAHLYGENCAGCHGVQGKPGAAISLSNPMYLSIVDDTSMRRVIADGVRGTAMPPFAVSAGGSLMPKQIDIVVAGIRNSIPTNEIATDAPAYSGTAPGDPSRGAETYSAYCRSCHGPDGRGGTAGSIVDGSYLSLVSDQYLRTVIIAGRTELGHPAWNDYQPAKLTPGQVSDLVAWLVAHRPHHAPLAQGN